MTIKVIEGLKPWEVMKAFEEGKEIAVKGKGRSTWENCFNPNWNWYIADYAVIDDSKPEIDWSKFDYDFFNQYGGIPVRKQHSQSLVTDLVKSPWYYWPGGKCPVPDNVEVEVITRVGNYFKEKASEIFWEASGEPAPFDFIAFRLTGDVQ